MLGWSHCSSKQMLRCIEGASECGVMLACLCALWELLVAIAQGAKRAPAVAEV